MSIERDVELHKLTISGLPEGVNYEKFLVDLRLDNPDLKSRRASIGSKDRYLDKLEVFQGLLSLRVGTLKPGISAQLVDAETLTPIPNPYGENAVTVEYSHGVGVQKRDGYMLLLEKNQDGISANYLKALLQFMVKSSKQFNPETQRRITINLEPVPSIQFIEKVRSFDRITSASIQIVQPNPGWDDHEAELNRFAKESNAIKAEINLIARSDGGLSRTEGIVPTIERKFGEHTLDGAIVKGKKNGKDVRVTTRETARASKIMVELDPEGNANMFSVWNALNKRIRDMGE